MKISFFLLLLCLIQRNGYSQNQLFTNSKDSSEKINKREKAAGTSHPWQPISNNTTADKTISISDGIAVIALIASLASVVISYSTLRIQRKHNIKSVKPIIHVGQWDYENRLGVTLKNCGTGVAIIKRYWVYNHADDKEYSNIYKCLPATLGAGLNYSKYWTPDREFAVQPGEIIDLILVPIPDMTSAQITEREWLRSIICQLDVKIQFEDVYENKFPIYERDLKHFGRKDNVNKSIID